MGGACGPPPMRTIPDPLYGVTFDDVNGSSQSRLNLEKAALQALGTPHLPIVRLVVDQTKAGTNGAPLPLNADGYIAAVDTFQPIAYVMLEILDSAYMKKIDVAGMQQRATELVNRFGEKADIFEIANEINGLWTFNKDATKFPGLETYQDTADKMIAAFDIVKQRGKKTAMTLWYNIGCVSNNELTPLQFVDQYIPPGHRMRDGLDYVFISYYEVPCANGRRPSVSELKTFFQAIHTRFANAKVGFGEVGLELRTTATTFTGPHGAESIANYYYALSPLLALSYYVGGYFWWYSAQDIVPWPGIMGNTLKQAMAGY